MKTYYVVLDGEVVSEIEADKVEFYNVPNNPEEIVLLLLADSQIVAAFRKWDSVQ